MVGRDIGTVVLPEAQVKIYLDASLEERTRRRYLEYRQRGILRPFREVKEELVQRDRIDSTREMAPLRPAEDAVIVDSTCVPIDKVVRRIERVIRQALEQVVGG